MPTPTCDERPVALSELGDRLSALRLCERRSDDAVRRSLERLGQLTPVVAFDAGDALEVIDGFKRLRTASRLGWQTLRVCVLGVGEAEAIAAITMLHERPALTELEEGWIILALSRKHGMSQGAIGQLMGRHKSWVCRRLMLAQRLDEAVQADVRLGLLSPRAATAVAALPRGNQRQAAARVIARGMTTRQAEGWVRQLLALDEDERRLALQSCSMEVQLPTAPGRPTRPEGERFMADVKALVRIGVRLEVRLLGSPLDALGLDTNGPTRAALDELARVLGVLERAIARATTIQDKAYATLADT